MLGIDSQIGVYLAANASGVDAPLRTIGQLAIDLMRGKTIGTGFVREIAGIGTALEINEATGELRVTSVLPQSPAAATGIDSGTIIESINGLRLQGKDLQQCLDLLKGPVGTKVKMSFKRTAAAEIQEAELSKQAFLVPS
jgi:C-terminal processing protease CtpA/Prc